MKKKESKLPLPKKLKLENYDILQTLGTGRERPNVYRIIWQSKTCKREKCQEILGHKDFKEG